MKWTLNRAFRLNATFNVHGKIGAEMNCLPRSWVQWYSVCSVCAGSWFGPITSTVITIKWKIKKIKWLSGPSEENPSLAFPEASYRKHSSMAVLWELALVTIGGGGTGRDTIAPVTLQTSLTLKTQPWWTKIWYMNLLEMSDNQLLEYQLSLQTLLVVSGN